MDEEISYSSLNEYFEALLEKSKRVFSVFCEVFGEDRCDIQINTQFYSCCVNCCSDIDAITPAEWLRIDYIETTAIAIDIIVYFPEVDISNEKDKHHTIKELYVRTSIKANGRMGRPLMMLRTRYTTDELEVGYKHSHTGRIRSISELSFTDCCLGNAPIRSTATELLSECDLDRWNVYCLQLDQYVGIESLDGGPYVKMGEIGTKLNRDAFYLYDWDEVHKYSSSMVNPWILYKFLLTTPINFVVRDGVFIPAMSALECALRVTEICKEDANTKRYLTSGVLIGNKLYSSNKTSIDISGIMAREGTSLLTFKGEPKYLSIDRCEEENMETMEIINPGFLNSIIEPILIYVNTLSNGRQEKYGELSRFTPFT